MDIQGLKFRVLPAPTIITDFVKNDPKCNYELYLVELLNNSKWFSERYSEKFVWCANQSHHECDTYSGGYGLDFKLMLAESRLQGISIFSTQYTLLTDEKVSISPSKNPNGTIVATRLHTALRRLTIEELKVIRGSEYKQQTVEFDIQKYLDTLETKKNILLFYPCQFYFGPQYQHNRSIENFTYALNSDFASSFAYRALIAPDYDTFFVTIYYTDFVLFEVKNNKASYLESIPTGKYPTFMHLWNIPQKADEDILKKWLG